MLEISGRQSPVSDQKKFRRSKFLETVATVVTSHFRFYYYHFPKESGKKKQSNQKKMQAPLTFIANLFHFQKEPFKAV